MTSIKSSLVMPKNNKRRRLKKSKTKVQFKTSRLRHLVNFSPILPQLFKVVSVLVIIIAISWLIFGSFFNLTNIVCQEVSGGPCSNQVLSALNQFAHRSIFTLSSTRVIQTVMTADPNTAEVRFSVKLPNTVSIIITPISPVAQFTFDDPQSAPLIVSGTGKELAQAGSNLPQISVDRSFNRPSLIKQSDLINFTIELLHSLNSTFIKYDKVSLADTNTVKIQLPDNRTAVFSPHQPATRQVTTLQSILSAATIKTDNPIIDVRFNDPVLKPLHTASQSASISGKLYQ